MVATFELSPVYVNTPLLFDVGGVTVILAVLPYVTDGIEKLPKDGVTGSTVKVADVEPC